MSATSPVRSWPARPTNGMPWRSSSAPGPSPTNTRSAPGSPSPKTTWLRPWVANGHFVQASASRSSSSNDANGDSTTNDTPDGMPPSGHRVPDGVDHGAGGDDPETVEMGVDAAGGESEGEVPVEARVRWGDGPAHRMVRGLRQQVAFELGETGVCRDDDQRCVLAFDEGQRLRERRGIRGGRPAPPQAPVVAHHLAERVH